MGNTMDSRLNAILDEVGEINRNLLLISGDFPRLRELVEDAQEWMAEFQKNEIFALQKAMEAA